MQKTRESKRSRAFYLSRRPVATTRSLVEEVAGSGTAKGEICEGRRMIPTTVIACCGGPSCESMRHIAIETRRLLPD